MNKLIYDDIFFYLQSNNDLTQSIADHQEWLNHLSERVETLHMNTSVFVQVKTTEEILLMCIFTQAKGKYIYILSLLPDESKASCLDRQTDFQTWLPHGSIPPDWWCSVRVWLVSNPHTKEQWRCLWNVLQLVTRWTVGIRSSAAYCIQLLFQCW